MSEWLREKERENPNQFLTLLIGTSHSYLQVESLFSSLWSVQWSGTAGPARGRSLIRRRNGPWPAPTLASKVTLSTLSVIPFTILDLLWIMQSVVIMEVGLILISLIMQSPRGNTDWQLPNRTLCDPMRLIVSIIWGRDFAVTAHGVVSTIPVTVLR